MEVLYSLFVTLASLVIAMVMIIDQRRLKEENKKLKKELSKKQDENKRSAQEVATDFIEIWDGLCVDDEKLRAELTIKLLNGEIRGSEKWNVSCFVLWCFVIIYGSSG